MGVTIQTIEFQSSYFDLFNGLNLTTSVNFTRGKNEIGQLFTLEDDKRVFKYVNFEKVNTTSFFLNAKIPLDFYNSTISIDGRYNFQDSPFFFNSLESESKQLSIEQNLTVISFLPRKSKLEMGVKFRRTSSEVSDFPDFDFKFSRISPFLIFESNFTKWIYNSFEVQNIFYTSNTFSQRNIFRLNFEINTKEVLNKNLSFSLKVFDLLNQNVGIAQRLDSFRNVTTEFNVLGRYIMFSVQYKFFKPI